MTSLKTILLFLAVLTLAYSGHAAPEFQADGRIVSGDVQLVLRPSGLLNLFDAEGRMYDFFLPLGYPGHPGRVEPGKLKDAKVTVDVKTRTTTFSAVTEPPGGPNIPIRYSMTLTPQGNVRITLQVDSKGPFNKHLSLGNRVHVTRDVVAGGTVTVAGKPFPIESAPPGTHPARMASGIKNAPIILNDAVKDRRIAIVPRSDVYVHVTDNNTVTYRPPYLDVSLEMQGNALTFDLELPSSDNAANSAHTYAGIDFWALDRLPMPQYGASRNLVQNPGFEAGFNYWRLNSYGSMSGVPKFDAYYEISSNNPHSGLQCLSLRGEAGQSPAQTSSFAIPVEKGTDYTLSLYARTDLPGTDLDVTAQGFFDGAGRVLSRKVKLSAEWQRFTFAFKAPHYVLSVGFGNQNASTDSRIFVDSVQVEPGTAASEFTTKPILASVRTEFRGNLWEPGTDPEATIDLSGEVGMKGTIRITQTDLFDSVTDRGEHPFVLDATGRGTVALPWAAELATGLYVISTETRTSGGFTGADYGRMTVMRFLSNTHKHKDIFSSPFTWRYPEWKHDLEFYKRVGIGSSMLHDPAPHRYHEILRENGMFHTSSIYDGGHGFKEMNWHQDQGFDLTAEQLQQVEELSFRKAKEYPEVKAWKFFNEPHVSDFLAHPEMFQKMQKAIAAAQRGIRRASPDAKFVGSDPSNMFLNSGIAFVDKDLAAAGNAKPFDIAAIHPYRARPEEPDRDKDTAAFLEMLDRHGFKGDAWFTEGIYHQNYIVPLWELNTHQGCSSDHYRAGAASYGLGWGERMAMAYAARSWLVSLKYSDRVKMDVDWGFWNNSRSDLENTPCALAFASNTLGNVLGNSDFYKDLALGYEVRCYVFENERKQPVAAIWYANLDCDKGRTKGPQLDLSALATAFPGMQLADFMGGIHPMESRLQLSPFPIFITGAEGSAPEFTEALGKAGIIGGKGQLHAWLAMKSPTEIEAVVENTLNRGVSGKYRLTRGGDPISEGDFAINPLANWTIPFTEEIKSNSMNVTNVMLEVSPAGGPPQRFELAGTWMLWPKRTTELSMDGSLAGWENAFHSAITNKVEFAPFKPEHRTLSPDMNPFPWKDANDLSAELYATWDEKNLYLVVKVKDDILHPGENPQRGWAGDGLQLYFDGWANAATRRNRDYDGDDQSFIVWPKPPEAVVFRDVAPERQLAFLDQGAVKDAKTAAVRAADGDLVYHIALLLRDIQPVKLEALQKFGFAALVNEHDGDYRKRSLTLTPEKTEPYRRPDLYPTVILTP